MTMALVDVAHAEARTLRVPRFRRLRAVMRRRVAPTAGIALLLAGGALCVRIMAAVMLGAVSGPGWVFTAAACVLAGVSLVLIALPKFVPSREGTATPDPPAVGQG
ncbi:MAG: hypothetical protein U0Y82_02015 [Thermoleophilia bacterium]